MAELHVSAHGTNHPAALVSMPHKKVGFEELPTYASSWSPRSLAASGGDPVKLRNWSTVPAGTSTTPLVYVR